MKRFRTERGDFDRLGVTLYDNCINIAVENQTARPLVIELFDVKSLRRVCSLSFPVSFRIGDVCAMKIYDIDPEKYAYRLKIGNVEFTDPYARETVGNERFGKRKMFGLFKTRDYVFEYKNPDVPWNEEIFYLLNVRSFTKDKSSGVKNNGTFKGVAEKIRYLKDLGITSVILQPCYDFNEILPVDISGTKRLNLWGYSGGNYFAPKQAYSCGEASLEFKEMTDKLHGAKIEVIMQFYFEPDVRESFITECIRYWVLNYHIDGVQLMGLGIPVKNLVSDPLLKGIKLIFPEECFKDSSLEAHFGSNTGIMSDSFMYDSRRYLKGDEDLLGAFSADILNNPEKTSIINYITNYSGFTLNDLVSFDRKHNESNGEENRDGSDYNYSWNCGAEGKSRRKAVISLRRTQIRNAFVFMLLSQGSVLIRAGDEFLNSQSGNNNAYCQDNRISYLNWEDLEKNKDIFEFLRNLIKFRKSHPVFRSAVRKKMIDYISCGYPDVSFHGEQAWNVSFANYNRHFGIMYMGAYEKMPDGGRDEDFFVAYNMHWTNHRFHPPKPPKNKKWTAIMNTQEGFLTDPVLVEDGEVLVRQRSIVLLEAVDAGKKEEKK